MNEYRRDIFLTFAIGAAVGAGVALLYAPASGEETRRRIAAAAVQAKATAAEKLSALGEGLTQKYEAVREQVGEQADDIKTAVEAGREAYRDSRTKHVVVSPPTR